MGTYTIISLAIGFIIILFFGWIMYVHYTNDDLEHWVPPTLIVGMLIIMLFGSIGYGADKSEKLHREIKDTITFNYNDVTNYHDNDRQNFVSDSLKNHKMELNYVVIDIIFGVILTFFVGVGCYKAYYNGTSDHWIPQTIISGLIIISILACIGKNDDTNIDIEKSIKNTITANYDDVLNYHNEDDNKTFASGDSRYSFDYDEKTKTLIVFTDSKVDAVFVDGIKKRQ